MDGTTFPSPSNEEEAVLNGVIEDWSTRTSLQRAICLSIVRGSITPDAVARDLLITIGEVEAALVTVWGVLYDRTKNRYYIK